MNRAYLVEIGADLFMQLDSRLPLFTVKQLTSLRDVYMLYKADTGSWQEARARIKEATLQQPKEYAKRTHLSRQFCFTGCQHAFFSIKYADGP